MAKLRFLRTRGSLWAGENFWISQGKRGRCSFSSRGYRHDASHDGPGGRYRLLSYRGSVWYHCRFHGGFYPGHGIRGWQRDRLYYSCGLPDYLRRHGYYDLSRCFPQNHESGLMIAPCVCLCFWQMGEIISLGLIFKYCKGLLVFQRPFF